MDKAKQLTLTDGQEVTETKRQEVTLTDGQEVTETEGRK